VLTAGGLDTRTCRGNRPLSDRQHWRLGVRVCGGALPGGQWQRGGDTSAVAAVALQNLDPVVVRIGEEEEPGHQGSVAHERDDLLGFQPGRAAAGVLGVEIVVAERHVAVALAQRTWLGAGLVQGELDLEVGFRVAQIDECERLEVGAVGDLEPEGRAIERDRPVDVEHAQHYIHIFRHAVSILVATRNLCTACRR